MYQGKLKIVKSDLIDPLLNKSDLNDKCCLICMDLATSPVTCTVCKSLFCLKCACMWKSDHNQCPKKCHKPWKFNLIDTLNVTIKCPFSDKCNTFIPEKLSQHMQECEFAPQQVKFAIHNRKSYVCDKGHLLEFWVIKFSLMNDVICSQCEEISCCRSICKKCDTKYCVICRPPPCSKKECPNGHTFLKGSSELYICDNCGLKPLLFDQDVYDDMICNFGLCESCYDKLPQTNSQKALPNNGEQCNKGHFLTYLEKGKEGQCTFCTQTKIIDKECQYCKEMFCMSCKPVRISAAKKCLKGHLFQKKADQQCRSCGQIGEDGFKDEKCNIFLCSQCFSNEWDSALNFERASIYRCSLMHQLYYNFYDQLALCQECDTLKRCLLRCVVCKKVYCQQCKPSPFKDRDNFGHLYQVNKKEAPCRICQKIKECQTYCIQCECWVCQECKEFKWN